MANKKNASLRWWFGALSFLYLVAWIALMAESASSGLGAPVSPPFFLSEMFFRPLAACAFAFVSLRFTSLIQTKAGIILTILHVNFWGGVALAAVDVWYGGRFNYFAAPVSVLIYVALWRSVARCARDQSGKNASNRAAN